MAAAASTVMTSSDVSVDLHRALLSEATSGGVEPAHSGVSLGAKKVLDYLNYQVPVLTPDEYGRLIGLLDETARTPASPHTSPLITGFAASVVKCLEMVKPPPPAAPSVGANERARVVRAVNRELVAFIRQLILDTERDLDQSETDANAALQPLAAPAAAPKAPPPATASPPRDSATSVDTKHSAVAAAASTAIADAESAKSDSNPNPDTDASATDADAAKQDDASDESDELLVLLWRELLDTTPPQASGVVAATAAAAAASDPAALEAAVLANLSLSGRPFEASEAIPDRTVTPPVEYRLSLRSREQLRTRVFALCDSHPLFRQIAAPATAAAAAAAPDAAATSTAAVRFAAQPLTRAAVDHVISTIRMDPNTAPPATVGPSPRTAAPELGRAATSVTSVSSARSTASPALAANGGGIAVVDSFSLPSRHQLKAETIAEMKAERTLASSGTATPLPTSDAQRANSVNSTAPHENDALVLYAAIDRFVSTGPAHTAADRHAHRLLKCLAFVDVDQLNRTDSSSGESDQSLVITTIRAMTSVLRSIDTNFLLTADQIESLWYRDVWSLPAHARSLEIVDEFMHSVIARRPHTRSQESARHGVGSPARVRSQLGELWNELEHKRYEHRARPGTTLNTTNTNPDVAMPQPTDESNDAAATAAADGVNATDADGAVHSLSLTSPFSHTTYAFAFLPTKHMRSMHHSTFRTQRRLRDTTAYYDGGGPTVVANSMAVRSSAAALATTAAAGAAPSVTSPTRYKHHTGVETTTAAGGGRPPTRDATARRRPLSPTRSAPVPGDGGLSASASVGRLTATGTMRPRTAAAGATLTPLSPLQHSSANLTAVVPAAAAIPEYANRRLFFPALSGAPLPASRTVVQQHELKMKYVEREHMRHVKRATAPHLVTVTTAGAPAAQAAAAAAASVSGAGGAIASAISPSRAGARAVTPSLSRSLSKDALARMSPKERAAIQRTIRSVYPWMVFDSISCIDSMKVGVGH